MEILRDHKDSVMAMLEAFVYDPLISWRLVVHADADGKRASGSAVSGANHSRSIAADGERDSGSETEKNISIIAGGGGGGDATGEGVEEDDELPKIAKIVSQENHDDVDESLNIR
jgi:phosphatidylinositol kinase/protein kinase (PI-3  family)